MNEYQIIAIFALVILAIIIISNTMSNCPKKCKPKYDRRKRDRNMSLEQENMNLENMNLENFNQNTFDISVKENLMIPQNQLNLSNMSFYTRLGSRSKKILNVITKLVKLGRINSDEFFNTEPQLSTDSSIIRKYCGTDVYNCGVIGKGIKLGTFNLLDTSSIEASSLQQVFNRINFETDSLSFDPQDTGAENTTTRTVTELINKISSSSKIKGSFPVQAVSLAATISAVTGSTSTKTENVQTNQLTYTISDKGIKLKSEFMNNPANLQSAFYDKLKSLPIKVANPNNSADWRPFNSFLTTYGDHVITSATYGANISIFNSIANATDDYEKILRVKSCIEANMDGNNPDPSKPAFFGGIKDNEGNVMLDDSYGNPYFGENTYMSLEGPGGDVCAAYDSSIRKRAESTTTIFRAYISGGNAKLRNELVTIYANRTKGQPSIPTREQLEAFINSSTEGTKAIKFEYVPMWDFIIGLHLNEYLIDLANGTEKTKLLGTNVSNEDILQIATNLEAAYVYNKLDCQQLRPVDGSGRTQPYQEMRAIPGATGDDYGCWAARTGCRHNSTDCHSDPIGYCKAYGPTAFDKGVEFPGGNDNFRTKIRGSKEGTTNEGINQSCSWSIMGGGCVCNKAWSGGLRDRYLWKSGQS